MTTLYGIKNCDTMKKAQKWLEANAISFEFHDYRKQGISSDLVLTFAEALGWDAIINKRGTTYRNLSDEKKALLSTAADHPTDAARLLSDNEAILKRPILLHTEQYHAGFKDTQYQAHFNK